ncbi:MAG TPA: hypothetical protein VFK47_00380 [Ktedonobacteraceae bacterium]|nr:hypothetical protein [Ktedonobacteraceae bacterium]
MYQLLIVGSCGKKQLHLKHEGLDEGRGNYKIRLYISLLNEPSSTYHVYDVAELQDVRAKALEIHAAALRREIESCEKGLTDTFTNKEYMQQRINRARATTPTSRPVTFIPS